MIAEVATVLVATTLPARSNKVTVAVAALFASKEKFTTSDAGFGATVRLAIAFSATETPQAVHASQT